MPVKTRSMTKTSRTSKASSKTAVASIIASMTSKTDKNNKLKKRKIQQTHDRNVNRVLKETVQQFHEELTPADFPEETSIYNSLLQVSQISYNGSIYQLFWNPFTKKALIEIPDSDLIDYSENLVQYDGVSFVEYEDNIFLDIIYQHFGPVHIFPNDSPPNILSSDSLYTLISTIPLTQYSIVNQSYDCGHY